MLTSLDLPSIVLAMWTIALVFKKVINGPNDFRQFKSWWFHTSCL